MLCFRRDIVKFIIAFMLLFSLPLVLMPEPAWLLAHQQEEQALLEQGKQYYIDDIVVTSEECP
jgi:hypothetical protein